MTHLFIQAHVVLRHLYIANDRGDTPVTLEIKMILIQCVKQNFMSR
jgi:hypothetical protein